MSTDNTPANTAADGQPPAEPQVLAFAVPHQVLTDALAFVVKGLPKRPNVPVLTGVLIEGDANGVTVAGFDYEQARWYDLEGAKVTTPGRLLVSAARLAEMVKALRKGTVVGLAGEGVQVQLTDGKTNYTLPTFPVEDYPTLPDMPPVVGMVDAATLLGAAVPVAAVAGRDETLPMMTGVRLEGEGGRLSLLATDRYRLEHRDIAWANEADEFKALIPAVTLVEFVKPLAKLADTITLWGDGEAVDGRMGFEAGPARAYTRLLDGSNYPPVRSLFPSTITAHADVTAKDLLDSIGRVALAAERTTPVLLDFTASGLRLSAGDGDGAKASDPVEATWVGPDDAKRKKLVQAAEKRARKDALDPAKADGAIKRARREVEAAFDGVCIGFNPAYLSAGVKLAGTARVRFELVNAFKPAVIRPLDDEGNPVPDVRHLLMPIRVTADESARELKTSDALEAALAAAKAAEIADDVRKPAAAKKPATKASAKAPAAKAEPVAEPVADAAVVLDRDTPHDFVRATDNGKPAVWSTKCLCGAIRKAKVHDGQGAGDAKPAAEPVAEPVAVAEPVDERPWLVVMTLAERVGGRLTTVATEKRALEALRPFKVSATPVVEDAQGKRMYVGAKDEDMANRMHKAAMGKQVPAQIERGELPEASAKEVPVVAGEQVDVSDPRQVSEAAFVKFGSGDYAGALELIEAGMAANPDFEFVDETGAKYGWDFIRQALASKAIEAGFDTGAEGVEPEADDEQDGDAPAQAEAKPEQVKTCGRCKGTGPKKKLIQHRADCPKVKGAVAPAAPATKPAAPASKPVAPQPAAPAKGKVGPDAIERLLAEALAGQPDDVVAETLAFAKTKLGKAEPAAPAKAKGSKVKPAKGAKASTAAAQPEATADSTLWTDMGMAAPSSRAGERVYLLPRGTRLMAVRKAAQAALDEAHGRGDLPEKPKVAIDRDARPAPLTVGFGTPGALTSVVGLVDEIVSAVLPEFLPERATANA